MRAVLCRKIGDLSAIRVEEVPSPDVAGGQVRIAVKAAGVNFPDILMIEGKYQVKKPFPFSPGLEAAGTVAAVGAAAKAVPRVPSDDAARVRWLAVVLVVLAIAAVAFVVSAARSVAML